MQPLLTIAIPTYNRKEFINIALESIYSQYDKRVEVIVSDNCSTDGTEEYIRLKYPQVNYYKNEKNVGMENFQRCYKRANGKFVWLLGDDDVITEGSLAYILDFLDINQNLSLIFLNHTSFSGIYKGLNNCTEAFIKNINTDIVTDKKTEFIKYAKYQLTFISCFLFSREKYLEIENPDQYNANWFLQTCIAFKVTEKKDALLGVVSRVCVAQNVVAVETKTQPTPFELIVEIFGETEKEIFCHIAPQCGYDIDQMKKVHSMYLCSSWPGLLLGYKAKGYPWKKAFWSKGFQIVKRYPKAWITIIPVALIPGCIAKLARSIKMKLIKD